MKVILDTNAYSLAAKNDKRVVKALEEVTAIVLPWVVVGELFEGFYGGNRRAHNEEKLYKFLAEPSVEVLYPDFKTLQQYGEMKNNLRRQGRPIPINDVWIAALAIQYELPVLTMDQHLRELPQVELVPLK